MVTYLSPETLLVTTKSNTMPTDQDKGALGGKTGGTGIERFTFFQLLGETGNNDF